ncbi:hypothetical protein GCM10023340_21040 [Nocardioides marinquilinus]|uniref:LPXTG cell wall anchor domain-containing protein n=1 Tax=Nocardioides marinquilinus TaxID=1210400 RepID=A0ABP9PK99_9ACTN
MRRRSLPLACALAGFVATSIGLVGLASANANAPTASATGTCDGLTMKASGFDGDKDNRWLAIVNGVPYQGSFGASATKTIPVLPAAENQVVFWTAQVYAPNRPADATFEVSGKVGPCAKEAAPTTAPAQPTPPPSSSTPTREPSSAPAPSNQPSSQPSTSSSPSPSASPSASPSESGTPSAAPSSEGPGSGSGRGDGNGPPSTLPDTGAPSPSALIPGASTASSVAALMIGLGLLLYSWVLWRRESA